MSDKDDADFFIVGLQNSQSPAEFRLGMAAQIEGVRFIETIEMKDRQIAFVLGKIGFDGNGFQGLIHSHKLRVGR